MPEVNEINLNSKDNTLTSITRNKVINFHTPYNEDRGDNRVDSRGDSFPLPEISVNESQIDQYSPGNLITNHNIQNTGFDDNINQPEFEVVNHGYV